MILMQNPNASFVAGYDAWKRNFNRHVIPGGKSMQIIAPYQVNVDMEVEKKDNLGNVILLPDGKPQTEIKKQKITKFHLVNVFDISQTEGEPLPTLVHNLTGSNAQIRALMKAIQKVSDVPIELKTTATDPELKQGAKGYYDKTADRIVVNCELEDMHMAKTMIHEFAHSKLHKETDKSREQKEIEAESLAYVICDHFGFDTSEYSFGYIASWAEKDIKELKGILNDIQANAHEMIAKIEPEFMVQMKLQNIENDFIKPDEMKEYSQELVKDLHPYMEEVGIINCIKEGETSSEEVKKEIENSLDDFFLAYRDKYELPKELYEINSTYRNRLIECIYLDCTLGLNPEHLDRAFIDSSMERKNYMLFESLAKPVLTDDAVYIKYASPGYMDLNVEQIYDKKIAISHYFEFNGDMMADPDMELKVDEKNRLLYPLSYQQDNLGYYVSAEDNPKVTEELNQFMQDWLINIQKQGFKVKEIHTDKTVYTTKDNMKELKNFCKENGIPHMVEKKKELER